jgi:hypothetical protein
LESDNQIFLNLEEYQMSPDQLEEKEPVETLINQFNVFGPDQTGIDPYDHQEQFQTNLSICGQDEDQSYNSQFEEPPQASFIQNPVQAQTSFIQEPDSFYTSFIQDLEPIQTSLTQNPEPVYPSFIQDSEPIQTSFIPDPVLVQTSFNLLDNSDISALLLDVKQSSFSNLHLPFSSTYSGRPDHSKRLTSHRKTYKTSESNCSRAALKLSPKESFKKAVKDDQLARAGIKRNIH